MDDIYKIMDNFYPDCYPKMSDGRAFGDFKTATRRNEQIKYVNNITRDDQYRLMLQTKGVEMMRKHAAEFEKPQCRNGAVPHTNPTRVSLAQLSQSMKQYNERNNEQKVSCVVLENYKMTEY